MFDLRLDHVVHTVRDPIQAGKSFEQSFGWKMVEGGRHEHMGTYNTLHYFDLTYIEWVSVFSEEIASRSEFGRWISHDLAIREGLSQFALRTSQMDDIVSHWQAKGLPFVGPVEGSRRRPDGSLLTWRLLFPAREDGHAYPLPFVIEWHESDEVRRDGLIARGALPSSGESPYRLSAVHSSVTSIERAQAQLHAYFGLNADAEPVRGEFGIGVCIPLHGVSLWFWERPVESPSNNGLQNNLQNALDTNRFSERSFSLQRPFQIDVERRESGEGASSTASFTSNVVELHGLRVRLG
jgi:hypothetical protein